MRTILVTGAVLVAACGGGGGGGDESSLRRQTWRGHFDIVTDGCQDGPIGPHASPIDPPKPGPELLVVGGEESGASVTVLDGTCPYTGTVKPDGSFTATLVDPELSCHDESVARRTIAFNAVEDDEATVSFTTFSAAPGRCFFSEIGPYRR